MAERIIDEAVKAKTGKDWQQWLKVLDVGFYGKGASKSQVVADHSRIASAAAAEKMKAYWKKALDGLLKVL